MLLKLIADFWINLKEDDKALSDLEIFAKEHSIKFDVEAFIKTRNWLSKIEGYGYNHNKEEYYHLTEKYFKLRLEAILDSLPEMWFYYYSSDDFTEGYELICLTDKEKITF